MNDQNQKNNKVFFRIHENYKYMNQMMVEEMDIASEHNGITGNYREEMWIKFFRSIIPQKFSLAQGVIIIDSYGNVSKEVDIAVFDEQYTPYVFQYNTLKFIPIEAVVIAIECKSTNLKDGKLQKWAEKIEELKPRRSGIARMVNGYVSGLTNWTQIKTKPIKILACIKNNKNGKTLDERKESLGDYFDFIIQEQNKTFEIAVKNEDKSLGWWGNRLNGKDLEDKLELKGCSVETLGGEEKILKEYPELKLKFDETVYLTNTLEDLRVEGNSLLSLNLQLNQLLMLVNNPMLFPHFAYAKRFKEVIEKEGKKKK